jgi:hypothetical protein
MTLLGQDIKKGLSHIGMSLFPLRIFGVRSRIVLDYLH